MFKYSVIDHIQKVRKQMIKEGFKDHTLYIDSDVAKITGFRTVVPPSTIVEVPTIFMGLKVEYVENLREELGGVDASFAITEDIQQHIKTPLSEYSMEELLDEIRRRTCGE